MTSPEQKPQQVNLTVDGNPETDTKAARLIHTKAATGLIYRNAVHERLGPLFDQMNISQSAFTYVADVMDRMAPRDPLEEMLVAQAMCAHARVFHLTDLANKQTSLANVKTVNEYADKASNTYRRPMLALAEYRKPPKAGDTYTAIKNANIAGQQVVVNGEPRSPDRDENTTNEQGYHDADTPASSKSPQGLPTEPGGARVPPSLRRPDKALGAIHRPEDGNG